MSLVLKKILQFVQKTHFFAIKKSEGVDKYMKQCEKKTFIRPMAGFELAVSGLPNCGATLHKYFASHQGFCSSADSRRVMG